MINKTLFLCKVFVSYFFLQPVMSDHGLLTTVAYKLGRDKSAFYALEVTFVMLLLMHISYYIFNACLL